MARSSSVCLVRGLVEHRTPAGERHGKLTLMANRSWIAADKINLVPGSIYPVVHGRDPRLLFFYIAWSQKFFFAGVWRPVGVLFIIDIIYA